MTSAARRSAHQASAASLRMSQSKTASAKMPSTRVTLSSVTSSHRCSERPLAPNDRDVCRDRSPGEADQTHAAYLGAAVADERERKRLWAERWSASVAASNADLESSALLSGEPDIEPGQGSRPFSACQEDGDTLKRLRAQLAPSTR